MATQLNPSEISELIKNRIEQFKTGATARNEGTITSKASAGSPPCAAGSASGSMSSR